MASKIYGPRKRRTRQHVIADQAVHHVEGFILDEGHTAERYFYDYGYDLVMTTYDERGYFEPNVLYFQVKASETLQVVQGDYVCDIEVRDYNLWMYEKMPVILVLYDASTHPRGKPIGLISSVSSTTISCADPANAPSGCACVYPPAKG